MFIAVSSFEGVLGAVGFRAGLRQAGVAASTLLRAIPRIAWSPSQDSSASRADCPVASRGVVLADVVGLLHAVDPQRRGVTPSSRRKSRFLQPSTKNQPASPGSSKKYCSSIQPPATHFTWCEKQSPWCAAKSATVLCLLPGARRGSRTWCCRARRSWLLLENVNWERYSRSQHPLTSFR